MALHLCQHALHLWQCKIAPKLLYGCEVFPLDPRANAIQHRVARTVLRAPKTVNSAHVLEFLGWLHLESLSDQTTEVVSPSMAE